MGARGSGPLESRTMFLSAAIFGAILLGMSAFVYYGEREEARIRQQGRPAQVTVVEKQKDKKGTTSLLLRLSDLPKVEPFWRVYLGPDREALKPGDTLPYVYEPAAPEAGIVGAAYSRNNTAMFGLIFAVFVAPFLLVGVILKRRERRRAEARPSPG